MRTVDGDVLLQPRWTVYTTPSSLERDRDPAAGLIGKWENSGCLPWNLRIVELLSVRSRAKLKFLSALSASTESEKTQK